MTRIRLLLLFFLLITAVLPAAAQENSPEGVQNPDTQAADLLGMTLEETVDRFGYPEEMYPFRGREPKQDTIVFYYPDHLYLYWYDERVWQVRFDHRYARPVMGVRMGDPRERAETLFGSPAYRDENSIVVELEDRGFPVRMRLFFEEDRIHDIYLYRGDF